jgi:hypothetical protein
MSTDANSNWNTTSENDSTSKNCDQWHVPFEFYATLYVSNQVWTTLTTCQQPEDQLSHMLKTAIMQNPTTKPLKQFSATLSNCCQADVTQQSAN